MTKQSDKLAEGLRALKRLQDKNCGVVESADLDESHRAILAEVGFIRLITKGWYVCSNPKDSPGDSTSWYASFWDFIAGYLNKRFGKRYCLNPESSLRLHTGSMAIPKQVVVVAKDTSNAVLNLPFDTSLLMYKDERRVPKNRVVVRGLQVLPLPDALCRVGPQFFKSNPREIEIALAQIRDVSELLRVFLANDGPISVAGRLVEALNVAGRQHEAARIVDTLSEASVKLKTQNPYDAEFVPTLGVTRERSPYILRLQSMWAGWRDEVLSIFTAPPGLKLDTAEYLKRTQDRYSADAYNSLSIEGYQVTDDLIARVAKGDWDPATHPDDSASRDAMAARGYYQAFQAVKSSIASILSGENAGTVVKRDHHTWYSALFAPSVAAGIIKRHELAGYRTEPVYIKNSMHTPLPREAVVDAMEALFDLISNEQESAVRAVLGHHLFVFIHPYFDGNGRIGRFMMNTLLASGGYPWTVIKLRNRTQYMAALEHASVRSNIRPLAEFILAEMQAEPD